MDVAVKAVADARKDRKRSTTKFIVNKVKEMKAQSTSKIGCDMTDVVSSAWTEFLHDFMG